MSDWIFLHGELGAQKAAELQSAGEVEVDWFSNRPGVYVRYLSKPRPAAPTQEPAA